MEQLTNQVPAHQATPKLRVLELYSGIGGMHYALKESGISFEVVLAVDINTSANHIYGHNFPETPLQSFGIEKLTLKKLSALKVDAVVMSPPCQPFTRVGKRRDCDDVRTKSFLHVMQLLKKLTDKPKYLLVENVKGFEDSLTHSQLVACLMECGYQFQQFLLTPLQFGIPNCRLRYYLIARLDHLLKMQDRQRSPSNENLSLSTKDDQNETLSTLLNVPCSESSDIDCVPNKKPRKDCIIKDLSLFKDIQNNVEKQKDSCEWICSKTCEVEGTTEELKEVGRNMRYCEEDDSLITTYSKPLSQFMEIRPSEDFKDYLLKDKDLPLFVIMDIVFPTLKKTTCFTKRYGHYIEGAGSVVQMTTDIEAVKKASGLKRVTVEKKNRAEWGDGEMDILRNLQLRYFTPREVANLLYFPPEFDWPPDVSTIQMYRCLGNSLNVHVVAQLLKLLVQGSTVQEDQSL